MTIKYQLSWEEFMEVHQESLPRPSVISFVGTLFIAIAVGAFGVVLTYTVDRNDKMLASLFCLLSAGLFVAAFWDLKIRTNKRRKKFVEELHSVYSRDHAGEVAFAFDEEKWIHQTTSGKQEVLWGALLSAVELENVFTLSPRNQWIAIPKRAMDDEMVGSLRRIVLKPGGKPSLFHLSLLDYLLTEVPSAWRSHPFLMAEAHAAGLLWVLMIVNALRDETGPQVLWGGAFAGILFFLTVTTQFWYFIIQYRAPRSKFREPWEAEFSETGIFVKTSKVNFFRAWATFRKVRETGRCFLLYVSPTNYLFFPKSCLPPEQQTTLRRILQDRVTEG